MLLKALSSRRCLARRMGFSTLYRVDAIEGTEQPALFSAAYGFQYPLSGRCY